LSYLKTLWSLYRAKPLKSEPLATKDEIVVLTNLVETEGWSIYLRILDERIATRGDQLLAQGSNDDLHYLRGIVLGMREAATLPKIIIQQEEALNARERSRATRSDTGDRSVALFGTPNWRRPA
jgi:hypothetical protein